MCQSLSSRHVALSLIQHDVFSQIPFGNPGQLCPGVQGVLYTSSSDYGYRIMPAKSCAFSHGFGFLGDSRPVSQVIYAEGCGIVSEIYIPQRAGKICHLQPFPK